MIIKIILINPLLKTVYANCSAAQTWSLKSAFYGIFNSVLCDEEDINGLQVLQNRAAQIVTRRPPRTSTQWLDGWHCAKLQSTTFV